MPAAPPPLLSIAEVAVYLGVSTKTVRRYISTRVLPSYRLGQSGTIRIRSSDVERFLVPGTTASEDDVDLDSFITKNQRG